MYRTTQEPVGLIDRPYVKTERDYTAEGIEEVISRSKVNPDKFYQPNAE